MAEKKFLCSILSQSPLCYSKAIQKCEFRHSAAAVACVIRLISPSLSHVKVSHPVQKQLLLSLLEEERADVTCSVLYIKRAERDGDRWSGDVAFPGGHLNIGESDFDAACREVQEEVGINVKDENRFMWLGRADEQMVYKRRGVMRIIPHIFLDLSQVFPDNKDASTAALIADGAEFVLQSGEVSHAWWAAFNCLIDDAHMRWRVWDVHSTVSSSSLPDVAKSVIKGLAVVLPVSRVELPANFIGLPPVQVQPSEPVKEDAYHLWGLTRTVTYSIVRLANRGGGLDLLKPDAEAASLVTAEMKVDNMLMTAHLRFWLHLRRFVCKASNHRIRPPFMLLAPLTLSSYVSSIACVAYAMVFL